MVWLLEHKAAVGFIVECSWIGKEHTKNKKSDRKDAVLTLKFRVKKKKKKLQLIVVTLVTFYTA